MFVSNQNLSLILRLLEKIKPMVSETLLVGVKPFLKAERSIILYVQLAAAAPAS